MENLQHHGSARPDPGSRFRQNSRLAQQVLGGKAVVLHYEGKRVLGLNGSGTVVWSLLDGCRSLAEIVQEVAARTGVPAALVQDDVLDFVAELARRDLVIESSADAAQP